MNTNHFFKITGLSAVLSGCYGQPPTAYDREAITYETQCAPAVQRLIESPGCGVAANRVRYASNGDLVREGISGTSDAYLSVPEDLTSLRGLISGGRCQARCDWVAPDAQSENGERCQVEVTLSTSGVPVSVVPSTQLTAGSLFCPISY